MAMSSQNPETQTLEMLEGFRFRPDDQELVLFYLYPKITNPNLFTTFNVPVRDCHLFGNQAREPWQIWYSFPKRYGEDLFFFTQLTKKGCLPSLSQLAVLCQLRKKEAHNPETVNLQRSTKKRGKRVADIESVDDARNTILQKPMIHVLDHQQQHIMGFDGLVDIVSRVENQLQHLHLQPLSNNGLGFGYFESFSYEDEQDFGIYLMATDSDSISTSNAAPPSASTFNPEENSRSIEFMSDEKDVGAASALDHDFCLQVLDLSGCYDEADGFPATKATAQASAYWT
ncbi:hypothetical protein NC652_037633 [Populus alba x Populus x berolinensis]|nr:hypothetical protein NC652_037633 [Populus alba x Populus x berolinensis]